MFKAYEYSERGFTEIASPYPDLDDVQKSIKAGGWDVSGKFGSEFSVFEIEVYMNDDGERLFNIMLGDHGLCDVIIKDPINTMRFMVNFVIPMISSSAMETQREAISDFQDVIAAPRVDSYRKYIRIGDINNT